MVFDLIRWRKCGLAVLVLDYADLSHWLTASRERRENTETSSTSHLQPLQPPASLPATWKKEENYLREFLSQDVFCQPNCYHDDQSLRLGGNCSCSNYQQILKNKSLQSVKLQLKDQRTFNCKIRMNQTEKCHFQFIAHLIKFWMNFSNINILLVSSTCTTSHGKNSELSLFLRYPGSPPLVHFLLIFN